MKNKQKNRWIYGLAGVIVLLFAGLVYAWSVLKRPIAADFPQWTPAQLNLTFTLVMIFFCLGGLAGGFVSKKIKSQLLVAISAGMFGLGFLLAAGAQSLLSLYLSFGLVCGLASGFAYNAVLSSIGRWFADKPGLISGILLMGFGIGSFLVGKVYESLVPTLENGWRSAFMLFGIVICGVLLLCAPWIRKPDAAPAAAQAPALEGTSPKGMLKTGKFWLFYLWALLLTAAGLMIVPQAGDMVTEAGGGLTTSLAVGVLSICNGLGRVIFGWLYDRLHRRGTMQLINGTFLLAGLVLLWAVSAGSTAVLVVGLVLTGLAYGGVPPTNSAFAAAVFGQKHYPINYPIINSNLVFASFSSTLAAFLAETTGSHKVVFLCVCGLGIIGAALSLGISLLERKKTGS